MRLTSRVLIASAAFAAVLPACAAAQSEAAAPATSATTLLETGASVDGAPFAYPTGGAAMVTAVDVVFPPGSRTGWHRHDVPLFNYVVEGALTVTYADGTERVYRAGEAVVEAVSVAHWGRNDGDVDARLLTVVIGAQGVPYTVETPAP